MSKICFEEVRVQVSISYTHKLDYDEEGKMFDVIDDVGNFHATEMQRQGCGCMKEGFIIFIGDKYPSGEEIKLMKQSVRNAIKKARP